jgi:EEF1A N-terminal glycine/lysine methyltransferase
MFSATSAGTTGDRNSVATFSQYNYNPYIDPTLPRPSSTYLGPPAGYHGGENHHANATAAAAHEKANSTTYHGVCLTVWSHADEERSAAIRRTLETAASARRRNAKVSMSSIATSVAGTSIISGPPGKSSMNGRARKKSGPWSGTDAEESETDGGAMSESDADFSSTFGGNPHGAGASTLFLPQNTVFWLPYALS